MAAGPGEAKLHEELLMVLPCERRHVEINTAVISVNSVLNSNLSKFCSVQAQQKMEEVLLSLRAIQRCHPPCFTAWGGDTLLKKVKDLIPLFLFVYDLDGEELPHWRGVTVAQHILEEERLAFKNDTLNLENVQTLNCFDFVLMDAVREEVQSWLNEVWKKAGLAEQNTIQATQKRCSSTTITIAKQSKSSSSKSPPVHGLEALQGMDDNVADRFA